MPPSLLKFKAGVVVPPVCIIAAAAVNARNALGLLGDTVITSGNDSKHMRGSLHYRGRALDIRIHGLATADVHLWAAAIQKRLGPDYQVIVESDHLHVEHTRSEASQSKSKQR